MKKLKKLLALGLALTMLGSTTACGDQGADKNAELLNKISTLETQMSDMKTELGGQIIDLQNSLDGYLKEEEVSPTALAPNYATEAYEMVKYIDSTVKNRDAIAGDAYQLCQKWIVWNLMSAGCTEGKEITYQNFTWSKYYKKDVDLKTTITASEYTTDGKLYSRQGWSGYVENEEGTHVKADITGTNIVVTKQGKTDEQIIVGMHYDGDGTGDNGSGISLGLITAMNLFKVETEYTIKFVFFDDVIDTEKDIMHFKYQQSSLFDNFNSSKYMTG